MFGLVQHTFKFSLHKLSQVPNDRQQSVKFLRFSCSEWRPGS